MTRLATLVLLAALPAAAGAHDLTMLPPGTRANALGTAFSTVTDDPYAVFYNPGNLTALGNLEAHGETARLLTPHGNIGEASFAYCRPLPEKEKEVVALGYQALRGSSYFKSDVLQAGYGLQTTYKTLQQPLYYGFGLKLASVRKGARSEFGLGASAGATLTANSGLKTSLVVSDLLLGIKPLTATVTLGNSYRLGDLTVLADFRDRHGYSEFYFGAEKPLFNGLVLARAGKGVAPSGGGYLALGAGINALPLTIDLAYSIPVRGYGESAGYYALSVGYRFGSPGYSALLAGDAARQVEQLKTQAADLRAQRVNLESAIAAYRANKSALESDLALMQGRARDLEQSIKDSELRLLELKYAQENPRPAARRTFAPAKEVWPKKHKVGPGETLRSIASEYYGNPNLWERVYEANERFVVKGLPAEGAVFTIPPPPPGK